MVGKKISDLLIRKPPQFLTLSAAFSREVDFDVELSENVSREALATRRGPIFHMLILETRRDEFLDGRYQLYHDD